MSRIYLKENSLKEVLDYGLASLKITNDLELLKLKKDVNEALSHIYAASNNYKKAYEYFIVYKSLNDSVFNEENIKKSANLENQYAFDKEKEVIQTKELKS